MKPLTVGSTFTGVGGADLGFEWAGFDIKWQCEFDSWKQQILRAHWPDVELFDDIRTMQDPSPVDVMIGGFPCQDLSVAGRRKGFDGERSVLAFEFLRVAESVQPRWIVLENVPGLLSSSGGRDFARLIDEVVGCGYGVAWRILDARYFGVPQRRRRIFIVARRADSEHDPRSASRLALRALFESSGGDTSEGWQAWTETTRTTRGSTPSGSSVGTHGDAGVGPTGTLTRMYSEQSGQDFGGGQASSRVVCEPDPAGALTKRYAKGVNTTMDDGAIIAHTSASDRVNGGGSASVLHSANQGGQRA
jgi:site-specific DNA-cytosine methylase